MIKDKLKSMDKIVYGIAVVAAALGAGYLLFGREDGHADAPPADAPVAVSYLTVEPTVVDTVVPAAGALSSKNASALSSKVMGRVAELGAQEGDFVARGKTLLRIESGEITAQAIQAQAVYNNAKLQYDRIKRLFDANASTRMELDLATLGLETAQAGLRAAQAMESYTIITAPISGRVVEKRINLGEMALPGQPILKIEDNRNLRLEATVREQDILNIRTGMNVRVQIDAMPGKDIAGRVSQVVPAADVRTHSFIVKIDVPADKGLITGMYGKAFFSTGSREAVLIPKSAVIELSGITGVYAISPDGKALFQMVQLGDERGGNVEVLAGLASGDRVVVNNTNGRIEGRKIKS